eukprot:207587_1
MAAGYHRGSITFIVQRDIWEYNISNNSFSDINSNDIVTRTTYGIGQFFTCIDDIIYMIDQQDGTSINRYNLETKVFSYNVFGIGIPNAVYDSGCMASLDGFLYIVGGGTWNVPMLADLQIYDISSNRWSTGSNMTIRRGELSCAVSSAIHTLFAIGGYNHISGDLDTVEYISVTNIDQNRWQYTTDSLNTPLSGSRAVYYDFISPDKMVYGVTEVAHVLVGNRLYAFGGSVSTNHGEYTWQYYDFTKTSSIISTNYTISIDMNECMNEQVCEDHRQDLEQRIVAVLSNNTNAVTYIESQVMDNQLVLRISIKTNSEQILDVDYIQYHIEKEVDGSSTFGDVSVHLEGEKEAIETTRSENDPNESITNQVVLLVLIILCVLVCVIVICIRTIVKRRKDKMNVDLAKMRSNSIDKDGNGIDPDPGHVSLDEHIEQPGSAVEIRQDNAEVTEGYDENEAVKNYVNLEDAESVKQWLGNTVGLPQFCNHFIDNGYDKMTFVKEIKEITELEEIGITVIEHQSILMTEIIKLRNTIAVGVDQDHTMTTRGG